MNFAQKNIQKKNKIKTGGASIIDFMVLLIDIVKGIQTQTAECLVLGEILAPKDQLIVVCNKMDAFYKLYENETPEILQKKLDKKIHTLRNVFKKTKFGKNVPMVFITANAGGNQPPGDDTNFDSNADAVKVIQKSKFNFFFFTQYFWVFYFFFFTPFFKILIAQIRTIFFFAENPKNKQKKYE